MKGLAVAIAGVTLVVASGLVTAGGAVTSKPLVAVQVDEFSVFPGTQGAPRGKVRFVVTNIGTVRHEFVVLKTAKPAGDLLKGNEADERGNVGVLDLLRRVDAGNGRQVDGTGIGLRHFKRNGARIRVLGSRRRRGRQTIRRDVRGARWQRAIRRRNIGRVQILRQRNRARVRGTTLRRGRARNRQQFRGHYGL